MRHKQVAAALCAAVLMGLSAGAALAGEVKGPPTGGTRATNFNEAATSHRLTPRWRRANRPSPSGRKTPINFLAMVVARYVFVGVEDTSAQTSFVAVSESLRPGHERGEEIRFVRGRIGPRGGVRTERRARFALVSPVDIHRQHDFIDRRIVAIRPAAAVAEDEQMPFPGKPRGNPVGIVLIEEPLIFRRAGAIRLVHQCRCRIADHVRGP